MNELQSKNVNNPGKIVDPVKIKNIYAIFSTISNDSIFRNLSDKTPIFCGGKILSFDQNVYNFKINDLITYITYQNDFFIELSSNLIFKLLNETNIKLIAILPYASYAMKVLRAINPKLGQIIVIIGLNFFSILLKKLIELCGVDVFIIKLKNDFNNFEKIKNQLSIINGLKEFLVDFRNNEIDFLIINSDLNEDDSKTLKNLNFKYKLFLNQLSIYDKGFKDPNYNNGIKYPYSYVRWDYRRNLMYFIKIIESELINLDFFKIIQVEIESIDEMTEKIKKVNKNLLILFKILQ